MTGVSVEGVLTGQSEWVILNSWRGCSCRGVEVDIFPMSCKLEGLESIEVVLVFGPMCSWIDKEEVKFAILKVVERAKSR